MNIYVGNLPAGVTEEDLSGLFSEHGNVSSAKIIRDNFSQQSRGFGFVEMPGNAEAQKALNTLNSYEFKGNKLIVNEARPRRDGGNGGRGRRF
jgi:RNA recognition motif-containing protein